MQVLLKSRELAKRDVVKYLQVSGYLVSYLKKIVTLVQVKCVRY